MQVSGSDGFGAGVGCSGFAGSDAGVDDAGAGFSETIEADSSDEAWDGMDASLFSDVDALSDVEAAVPVFCATGAGFARICPRKPVTVTPAFATFSIVIIALPSLMPLFA